MAAFAEKSSAPLETELERAERAGVLRVVSGGRVLVGSKLDSCGKGRLCISIGESRCIA